MRSGIAAGIVCALSTVIISFSPALAKHTAGGGGGQQYHPPARQNAAPPGRGSFGGTHFGGSGGGARGFNPFSGGSGGRHFGNSGSFGSGGRSFGSGGSGGRHFGNNNGFGSGGRHFGNNNGFGNGGRHFGNNNGFGNGGRHFGNNNGLGSGGRHFGSGRGFGSGGRHFGNARNFGGGAPRRMAGGRHYFYHGHSFARFRAGFYHWPNGYRYVHYGVGAYLPSVYWIDDYYISDYADYGLDEPPPDFVWMRYGPDLVLFDEETGEIAQVIPGAFEESADGDDGDEDEGQ